eukprot:CAMPEP_0203679154 /NCGR_PEP_ID=MMETSP0090-20130426/34611_1 /ASSEMBLY_ACC=CAM_ASM_001088 /TAXON_ID=426623 /ORGANISM="Chaetoceros affinis, Strain CCMP159" /LENGTH=79 /DNA_ID=CAMNT_0050546689 /DNA_START=107 /DNA_END=342 /DNA_ORIENTATION=-
MSQHNSISTTNNFLGAQMTAVRDTNNKTLGTKRKYYGGGVFFQGEGGNGDYNQEHQGPRMPRRTEYDFSNGSYDGPYVS